MNDILPPPVFSVRMVRELKGAPLACMILLLLADQPVSNEWLCRMSGYTDKPIAQAMKLLSSPEYQVAVKTYGGWRIADTFNLPLISRNNSVSTTTTNIYNSIDSKSVVVGRKFSDFDDEQFEANLEACRENGIGEPSASTIAGMAHVTPEYIKAHVQAVRAKKGATIGLAITRIKNNEKPTTRETEEDQRKKYVSGEYAEYIEC